MNDIIEYDKRVGLFFAHLKLMIVVQSNRDFRTVLD